MSMLYITEYLQGTELPVGELMQCPMEPPIAEQKIDFTSGAATSAAFNVQTTFVRIETDSTCSLVFGLTPVATTSNQRWKADQTEFRGVPAGLGYKVSVIANT